MPSARDAVHAPFDAHALAEEIVQLDVSTLCLASTAPDRETFLRRPDLGRRLDDTSREALAVAVASLAPCDGHSPAEMSSSPDAARFDLAIIVSDGLSGARSSAPSGAAPIRLAAALRERAPSRLVIVERGRVAIEDEIGQTLGRRGRDADRRASRTWLA